MDAVAIIAYVVFGIITTFVVSYISLKILNMILHYRPSIKAQKADPALSKNSVKFIHYDVHWTPKLFSLFKNEHNFDRAKEIVKELGSYDVVSITGAYTSINSPTKWFINQMTKMGFTNVIRLPSVDISSLEVVDGGVIMFSKLPVLSYDTKVFSISTDQDMLVAKGAIYAQLQTTPNKSIHVVATCLQSPNENSIPECQSVRMSQLREIMSMLSRKNKDNSPVVILGNFNIDARDETVAKRMKHNEYTRMLNTIKLEGYVMTDLIFQTYGEHIATYGDGDKVIIPKKDINSCKAIDYIISLVNENSGYTIVGQETKVLRFEANGKGFNFLSPHFGVASDILFEEKTNA